MKVALISGSRADEAALFAVKEALQAAGMAVQWGKIPIQLYSRDDRTIIAQTAATACFGIASYLQDKDYDLIFLHGDRYEILGAATAAFLQNFPIAHLGGGDITEGSQDDSIRHAITKLAHLHFATCAESREHIIQLGEHPSRVFNVGDPGLDVFYNGQSFLTRIGTLAALGLEPGARYFVVVYHPNTLGDTEAELGELKKALEKLIIEQPDIGLVLIGPNKDAGHQQIEACFRKLANKARVVYHANLARKVYLSALKHSIAIVGNSSSAFYEAPSLGTPAIMFGNRQAGRVGGNCRAWCITGDQVAAAMIRLIDGPRLEYENHYATGKACDNIVAVLRTINPKELLLKKFYEKENSNG